MASKTHTDAFCKELAQIWQAKAPDLRFGQLMMNFILALDDDPFYLDNEEFMRQLKGYLDA